jgi:hypothetical protein
MRNRDDLYLIVFSVHVEELELPVATARQGKVCRHSTTDNS